MSAIVAFAAAAMVVAVPESGVVGYPAAYYAGSQPETALDMINRTPGFTFDSGSSVRGFGGAAGNVLIDGARPASKDEGLEQRLQRIPASSVVRIDVIRGGASGIDMQGKTLIANVIRRSDGGGKATVTVQSTRSYDGRFSGRFMVDAERRVGATALEGSLAVVKAFDDGGVGPWTRTNPQGVRLVAANETSRGAAYQYKVTGAAETPVFGGKVKLNASFLAQPYDSTQRDVLAPPLGEEKDHFSQRPNTAEFGLRFERPFAGGLSFETYVLQQFGWLSLADDFTSDAATAAATGDAESALFTLTKHTGESIVRGRLRYEPNPRWSFEIGAEGDYNTLVNRTGYIQDGTAVALPAANVHVNETRGEVFATGTWRANSRLSLEVGLRGEASRIASAGDVISARTLFYPKPRAVLSWSPDNANQIRLRVEREVGQINFDDFTAQTAGLNTGTVQTGNPRLQPEENWVFEGAWDRHFWGGADVTVTLRHYALSNVVDRAPVYDPAGTYDSPGNIGDGSKDEVRVSVTLPLDRLGLKYGLFTAQGLARQSHVIDPTTGVGRSVTELAPSRWEAHYSQGLPRWKMSWGADFQSQASRTDYRFNEIDVTKYRSQTLIYLEYKPDPRLIVRAEVLNAGGGGAERIREVFNGPRNNSSLAYNSVRNLSIGRYVRLRMVRTFG